MANELKINNTNGVNMANVQANALKINEKIEDTSKDTQKPIEATAQESKVKATDKHVIMYIGSSEYTDSTGHKWHKNDEKTYDESEYVNRKDLHFMIKYGEMKHTIVTV